MPKSDFRSPRLFIDGALAAGARLPLDRDQSNYLGNVLRLGAGAPVLAFNGRDGEWRAIIGGAKRPTHLDITLQQRPQDRLPDITYAFAPLKHARLDYMVQKAVEMGAGRLLPVLTRHTQVSRINTDRMRANVIEAAEQCGILSIASVDEPVTLERYLAARRDLTGPSRLLLFCDEAAEIADPVAALRGADATTAQGLDLLIGPEGGFSEDERDLLLRQPHIVRLALGPRIMRADTAAVAALALVQAVAGDWKGN